MVSLFISTPERLALARTKQHDVQPNYPVQESGSRNSSIYKIYCKIPFVLQRQDKIDSWYLDREMPACYMNSDHRIFGLNGLSYFTTIQSNDQSKSVSLPSGTVLKIDNSSILIFVMFQWLAVHSISCSHNLKCDHVWCVSWNDPVTDMAWWWYAFTPCGLTEPTEVFRSIVVLVWWPLSSLP